MPGTHPTAAAGFGRSAAAYERGRPGYPRTPSTTWPTGWGSARGTTVLDLAAGTGKLTRMLVATWRHGDRGRARRRRARRCSRAPCLEPTCETGTAEAIPAPDGALDAVTVAQAFHWFDVANGARRDPPGRCGHEGAWALVWNTFDTSDGWVAALQALVQGYRRGEPQYGRSWLAPKVLESSGLFGPIEERMFGIVQELDTAGLLARIGSTSYIATLPTPSASASSQEIRALVADRRRRSRCHTAPTRSSPVAADRGPPDANGGLAAVVP